MRSIELKVVYICTFDDPRNISKLLLLFVIVISTVPLLTASMINLLVVADDEVVN